MISGAMFEHFSSSDEYTDDLIISETPISDYLVKPPWQPTSKHQANEQKQKEVHFAGNLPKVSLIVVLDFI